MISDVQEQKISNTPQQPANHKKASDPGIGLRLIAALTSVTFLYLCIAGLILMLLTLTVPVLKDATQGPVLLLTEVIQQIGIALFVTSIVSVVVTRLIENTRKELQKAGPYQKAQLYSDTERSVRWLRSIASLSSAETFQYKWFATAPYCFMLMSDESVLVEQYHYGKVSQRAGMEILGRDMPIHEYKRYQNIHGIIDTDDPSAPLQTYELMKSHFEFVFEKCAYDIPDDFAP